MIDVGIYNFGHTIEELKQLYDNPRSFKDVSHLKKVSQVVAHDDVVPKKDDVSKKVEKNKRVDNRNVQVKVIKSNPVKEEVKLDGPRIIGFKDLTIHAGATSLIYMLKKQLSNDYSTLGLEIDKRDFVFFNDKDMISCKYDDVKNILQNNRNVDIILVDLNYVDLSISHSICDDVIFLMESSTLMINRLVMLDNKCFEKIYGEKIVLNQSMLSERDVKVLQSEANIKFFDVLPSMDDRVDNSKILFPFLEKLGFYKRV